jgi:triosephosphate isomerase
MPQVLLTAQDIQIYDGDGFDLFARTGATSAEQIYRAGATGAILGHSEVGNSPDIVHAKLLTLLARRGSAPDVTILVGETWDEFEQHSSEEIAERVCGHLMLILKDVPQDRLSLAVIGYEPKWGSRGSGRDDMPPPSPQTIGVVGTRLRAGLIELLGEDLGKNIPLIYGGRSTPERTEEILQNENIEGLILGSACNTVEKTLAIADTMERVRPGKRKILHANFKAYNLTDTYEAYFEAFRRLDNSFTIYLSPCVADLREVSKLLLEYGRA